MKTSKYTTADGSVLVFYPVPDSALAAIKPPDPRPKRPMVEMEIKPGKMQKRPCKQGDPEFDEWQEDKKDWDEWRSTLQDDARIVLSLREYEYPNPLELPAPIQELINDRLIAEPTTNIEKKAIHLRDNELAGSYDEQMAFFEIQKLSGLPEEVVDALKRDFQDNIQKISSGILGDSSPEEDTEEADVRA